MLETIVRYIVQGLPGEDIARIVGCTPSYISQVKARPDWPQLEEKARKQAQVSAEAEARNERLDTMEKVLHDKIMASMDYADFRDLVRMMEILNRRKETVPLSQPTQQFNDNRVQTVVLQVTPNAVPELRLNDKKEVIGIGNQSLAPMGAGGVRKLFSNMVKDVISEVAHNE